MLKRRPWLRCLFQHLIEEGGVNSHSKNNPSSQLFVCLNFSSQYSSRSAFFIHSHKTFPFSPLTAPCFFKTLPSSLSDTFSLPLPFSLLSSLPSVSAFYFPATFFFIPSSHHMQHFLRHALLHELTTIRPLLVVLNNYFLT